MPEQHESRHSNNTLRPNFRPLPTDMSVDNYAFEVYRELRQALKGLVEKQVNLSYLKSQLKK